ncbi:hypothetical protein ACVWZD_000867 [Streptomyces sp. TE3672]
MCRRIRAGAGLLDDSGQARHARRPSGPDAAAECQTAQDMRVLRSAESAFLRGDPTTQSRTPCCGTGFARRRHHIVTRAITTPDRRGIVRATFTACAVAGLGTSCLVLLFVRHILTSSADLVAWCALEPAVRARGSPAAADSTAAMNARPSTFSPSPASPAPSSATAGPPIEMTSGSGCGVVGRPGGSSSAGWARCGRTRMSRSRNASQSPAPGPRCMVICCHPRLRSGTDTRSGPGPRISGSLPGLRTRTRNAVRPAWLSRAVRMRTPRTRWAAFNGPLIRQGPRDGLRGPWVISLRNQDGVMFSAWGPFWPWVMSKVTAWPSWSSRKPVALMLE